MLLELKRFLYPDDWTLNELEPKQSIQERELQEVPVPRGDLGTHHDHHDDTSFKSLLAGAVGGTLEVLTDHPIDLVKVRLQTATVGSLITGAKQPKHFFAMLGHVVKNEGITGLWQGASIRVVSHMPATAVSFWGYDVGKKIVRFHKAGDQKLKISELTFAGAISGIPVTLFETPLERIKCLMQTQGQSSNLMYKGPLDCGVQLFRQSGFLGLYRGIEITAARNIPGLGVWFGVYELFKKQMNETKVFGTNPSSSWISIIMSGGIAGSASWCVMIPFDAVKSVIQTSPHPLSISEAYRQVTAKSKLALFRGIGPIVLVAFPANAACFLGAEIVWKLMSGVE